MWIHEHQTYIPLSNNNWQVFQFFTSCLRFVMRKHIAVYHHLHIQDFIYICLFYKKNHNHFSREQYVTFVTQRRSWDLLLVLHIRVILATTLYVTRPDRIPYIEKTGDFSLILFIRSSPVHHVCIRKRPPHDSGCFPVSGASYRTRRTKKSLLYWTVLE